MSLIKMDVILDYQLNEKRIKGKEFKNINLVEMKDQRIDGKKLKKSLLELFYSNEAAKLNIEMRNLNSLELKCYKPITIFFHQVGTKNVDTIESIHIDQKRIKLIYLLNKHYYSFVNPVKDLDKIMEIKTSIQVNKKNGKRKN